MKRVMIASVLCLSFLTAGVNAAEYTIVPEGETVIVTETFAPGTPALLIVVKAGESIENNAETYAAEHCIADAEGVAKWTFDMPQIRNGEITDGKYDLYIKAANEEIKPAAMYYATVDSRNGLREKLREVDSKEKLEQILENEGYLAGLGSQGFEVDVYKPLVQNKDVISLLAYNDIIDFSQIEIDDVSGVLNNAVALTGLKNDSVNANKYLDISDMSFENVAYGDITDNARVQWINSHMKNQNINSIKAMKNLYDDVNMLYSVNTARVSDIEMILGKYVSGLGIENSAEYIKYSSLASKAQADENLVNKLRATPASSADVLRQYIGEAIPSQQPQGGGAGGGGGGAGGGSPSISDKGNFLSGSVINSIPTNTKNDGFKDLNEAVWAAKAITELAEAKIVSGDGNGFFNPNETMTREQFVTMLVLALDALDDNADCGFVDTNEEMWHYRYVASAFNKGIVQGISENEFGIGRHLTRQDMAVLCYRAAKDLKPVRERATFYDDEKIASYAREAVYGLYEAGAINGMGENTFSPESTATKAQGAMMIYNLFFTKQ